MRVAGISNIFVFGRGMDRPIWVRYPQFGTSYFTIRVCW